MSTKLREIWRDDTVYSESFCRPEDVLYEGSEDEDYENSDARRRRYTEAGQRFLDGAAPVLISAALKGPLDRLSGFINPWISNRHKVIARGFVQPSQPVEKLMSQSKNSITKPRPDPTLQARDADCHLPSPESLKQSPYTQQHPYLEADGLDKVNKWRAQVDPFSSNRNGSLIPDDAGVSTFIRKRRAPGSAWLRKVSTKRQRRATVREGSHGPEQQDDELDELVADMPSSSFESAAPASPSKRRSPRNATRRPIGKNLVESDDELSPNKAAAATLSSPVSMRNGPIMSSPSKKSQPPDYITSSVGTQTTPSRLRHVNVLDDLVQDMLSSPGEEPDKDGQVNLQASNEQGIEAMIDYVSETSSTAEYTTHEAAALEDTSDQPEQQRYLSEPPSSSSDAKMDGNLQCPSQKAEPDVKTHHLSSIKSEPPDVAQYAIQGPVEAHTPPDDDSKAGDSRVEELNTPGAQSLGDRIMKRKWVDEGVAHEGGAGLNLDGNLSETDSEGDSGSSIAAAQPFSPGGNEPKHAQDTNHPSASDKVAADDGKIASGVEQPPTMCTMNDRVQNGSESSRVEAPATPRQAERPKDRSEFSFSTVLNRFVPSTRWTTLARLALPPLSSPATPSKKVVVTNESADETENTDAQPSKTHKEVLSPRRHELMSDPDQLHEPVQIPQEASNGQDDSQSNGLGAEDDRVSESQQSPWVNTEHAAVFRSPLGILSANLCGATPFGNEDDDTATTATVSNRTQSPWGHESPADAASLNLILRSTDGKVDQTPFAKPRVRRPRTPEPQFCVKSFSSFMSPSPDRNQYVSLSASRPVCRGSQGCLPSSLKRRRNQKGPGLRVSWAASLEEFEGAPWKQNGCAARRTPKRQSSPPPGTPIDHLQRCHDTRFAKHFEAVANRKDGQPQNLLPTESQQFKSPGPFAMAETFMAADADKQGLMPQETEVAKHGEALACSRASEEPMDVVEDMVREMGDFWDPWNIDAELEQARKGATSEKT
ncbi:uncharacterized protein MAM_06558 [Metarhizium album ARSEF 1941]|uniref:Protamine P1 n=1 Tax=Metarhizium album (strain ARSEF 1941) TaxID=1081103 RepID=A0A0B2WHK9_METAS|nr:uncharacterized protein MAM_06558 [Metarhizium album ARSEF 1941]KHN95501.1 hypothetical protein MAM_06558 [Metarhizium album ARSEF 1941]